MGFPEYLKIVEAIKSKIISEKVKPGNGCKKKSVFVITKKLKIKAISANDEISQILDIGEGEPVLAAEQKLLDEKDHPIGWGLMYFTGEGYGLEAIASFS